MNLFLVDLVGAALHDSAGRRDPMIANYADHAANERTFLAWICTGLAVVAFGFFLIKLNVLVDAVGGSLPRLFCKRAGVFVGVTVHYAGLAMVAIGIVPRGVTTFAGTRDRRGDFLHLSRNALTQSESRQEENPWIQEPKIGPAQLYTPLA
jgi:putative membrane protein